MAIKRRARSVLNQPARAVPLAFLAVMALGTLLLLLPAARHSGDPDVLVAAFTTVSAICVTGLTTVDTATYWTPLGQGIILGEMQVGGLGIMSLATVLALMLRRDLSLSRTLVAQAESHTQGLGDIRRVLRRIVISMLGAEGVVAAILTVRFAVGYGESWPTALWHGVFHSVSAFTNGSFALYSNGMMGFASDALIIWPLCAAIIAGGIGYPVFFELLHRWRRPRTWSVQTRLTVWGTLALLVVGIVLFSIFEWSNERTIGNFTPWGKVVSGVAGGVVPRTAGFGFIDYGQIRPETSIITIILMFIGGGSAGTAGGIRVTTFFLLAAVIVAEARGEPDVTIGHRRIGETTIRQAITVGLLGVGVVVAGTVALVMLTEFPLDRIVFEVVSAFGTVGLSTGITPELTVPAQLVIMAVMFVGRVGTVTAASSLAIRQRTRRYHLPEERPLVG